MPVRARSPTAEETGHATMPRSMADLDELESTESKTWWRRDAAERHMATGEAVGEDEPGLDEDEFRCRSTYLFRSTGAV